MQAFPSQPLSTHGLPTNGLDPGMTLRDYFAGQALIALPNLGCGADLDTRELAQAAYQIADELIKARQ